MKINNLKKIFGIICVVLAVISIVVFSLGALAIDADEMPLIKALVIIIAILCMLGAIEFGYLRYIEKDIPYNFFLFDPQTKRNIPKDKMSFDVINRKLNVYLSGFAPTEGRLWTDGVLDNPSLAMGEEYKPAVAYKLLFDLAERDIDQGCNCFETASVDTVEFMCAALEVNGDNEIARKVRYLKASTPMNKKLVRDYLISKKTYLRSKLCNYIYDNIDKF